MFVLVGDAELDEGSNSEAIVYAGAVGLPNLTVIAVDNQSSSYGWGPGGIEAHFAVGGWSVTRVDGRDHAALPWRCVVLRAGAAAGGGGSVEKGVSGHERHADGLSLTTASSLLEEDPLAAVVLAEISADLFAKAAARHPDRVLNVGIREQLMVSVGGGLALAGMRPIVHTYAPFLVERAFEQVKLDLAHQGARAVLVSVGASYDAARAGRTHQAPEDVALLDTVPGFAVQVPGHPDEVPGLLREAVGVLDSRSAYLRLSTESNRSALPLWPGLQVVRPGRSGGGGRGGADAVAGARRGGRPGRDRGVRHHGAAVRRGGAAVAGLVVGFGRGGAGRAVPGRDVGVRVASGAGGAAAPAAQPGRGAVRAAAVRHAGLPRGAARAGRGGDPAFGDGLPRLSGLT